MATGKGKRRAEILIDEYSVSPVLKGVLEPLFSWVLVGANGAAVARSATDYRHRSNAVRAARRFAARLKGRIEVSP